MRTPCWLAVAGAVLGLVLASAAAAPADEAGAEESAAPPAAGGTAALVERLERLEQALQAQAATQDDALREENTALRQRIAGLEGEMKRLRSELRQQRDEAAGPDPEVEKQVDALGAKGGSLHGII